MCVFNLGRFDMDLCDFCFFQTLHLKSICCCLVCSRRGKINIKRKKKPFSFLLLARFLASSPTSLFPPYSLLRLLFVSVVARAPSRNWISLCAFPTEFLGSNQDVKNPLCRRRKKNFSRLSFCAFFLLLSFRLFFFLSCIFSDPLTVTTKLETLSEFFDLERVWTFFLSIFSRPPFCSLSITDEENYLETKKTRIKFTLNRVGLFPRLNIFLRWFYSTIRTQQHDKHEESSPQLRSLAKDMKLLSGQRESQCMRLRCLMKH